MVTQSSDGIVHFRFIRPDARQVFLAGDFNGWSTSNLPMQKGDDGLWHCHMLLAPGVYQFQYVADGQWYMDHAAFGVEFGPHGLNSVLHVDDRRAPERAARVHRLKAPDTAAA